MKSLMECVSSLELTAQICLVDVFILPSFCLDHLNFLSLQTEPEDRKCSSVIEHLPGLDMESNSRNATKKKKLRKQEQY